MARKTKSPSDMSLLIKSQKGTLSHISEKTASLSLLANIVKQTCPDLPEGVWNVANFNGNQIVIEVTSSVWSQRLQFERMKIIKKLTEDTAGKYNQIEIKVSPYRNKIVASTSSKKVDNINQEANLSLISENTAALLINIAQNAPKGLKEKLEKLATHTKK